MKRSLFICLCLCVVGFSLYAQTISINDLQAKNGVYTLSYTVTLTAKLKITDYKVNFKIASGDTIEAFRAPKVAPTGQLGTAIQSGRNQLVYTANPEDFKLKPPAKVLFRVELVQKSDGKVIKFADSSKPWSASIAKKPLINSSRATGREEEPVEEVEEAIEENVGRIDDPALPEFDEFGGRIIKEAEIPALDAEISASYRGSAPYTVKLDGCWFQFNGIQNIFPRGYSSEANAGDAGPNQESDRIAAENGADLHLLFKARPETTPLTVNISPEDFRLRVYYLVTPTKIAYYDLPGTEILWDGYNNSSSSAADLGWVKPTDQGFQPSAEPLNGASGRIIFDNRHIPIGKIYRYGGLRVSLPSGATQVMYGHELRQRNRYISDFPADNAPQFIYHPDVTASLGYLIFTNGIREFAGTKTLKIELFLRNPSVDNNHAVRRESIVDLSRRKLLTVTYIARNDETGAEATYTIQPPKVWDNARFDPDGDGRFTLTTNPISSSVLFKFEVPVDPGWTLTRITDFRVYFNNQETVIPESSLPAIMYSR